MNVNILDFGAVRGGKILCTEAFRKAVQACASSGGGYVDVPSGEFLTGTVALESSVYLRLSPGAVILGSEDAADYVGVTRGCSWSNSVTTVSGCGTNEKDRCRGLIIADRKTNCGVVGHGTVNGQRGASYGYSDKKGRPFLLVFSECSFVTVRDVLLENTGMFTFYGLNCEDVVIDGVRIRTADCVNGDGLDFDGGKRISISNCDIDAGDDAIGLKTLTPDEPIEDFSVTNCHLRSHYWGGVRIGPESAGDMKRITITGCTFTECGDGFKLQLTQDAAYEDFCFTGNVMYRVLRPLFITMNRYNMSSHVKTVRPPIGRFRRILISDLIAEMSPDFVFPGLTIRSGNFISAMPGSAIEDLTLSDIHFLAPGGGNTSEAERTTGHAELLDFYTLWPEHLSNMGDYPSSVLYLRHAKNVRMEGITFECAEYDPRAALCAEDVDGLDLCLCRAKNCGALLRRHRVTDGQLIGCRGEIYDFTDEQKNAWEEFYRLSLDTEREFAAIAEVADEASRLPIERTLEGTEWSLGKEDEGKTLLLPKVTGNFILTVNGKEAARRSLPGIYVMALPFSFRLSGLTEEKNDVRLIPLSDRLTLDVKAQIRK